MVLNILTHLITAIELKMYFLMLFYADSGIAAQ